MDLYNFKDIILQNIDNMIEYQSLKNENIQQTNKLNDEIKLQMKKCKTNG